MKYVNYLLLFVFVGWLSGWLFNHVSAWLGLFLIFCTLYFVFYKVTVFIRGKLNEKN